MKTFLKRWLPVILWAAWITFWSSRTDPYGMLPSTIYQWLRTTRLDGIRLIKYVGFVGHMFQFGMLAFLLARALVWKGTLTKKQLLTVFVISVAFAIIDELHQYFVPNRACQVFDVFLDALGALLGLTGFVLSYTLRFYLKHRDQALS